MRKPSVYIETTIPSYVVARPNRDMIISANQQITREWWESRRFEFKLFVSEVVRQEIQRGDAAMAIKRAELISDIPVLVRNERVGQLIRIYNDSLGLPLDAAADIAHISYAVSYELDYLLTWNCRHIANGAVIKRLQRINEKVGIKTPTIVTPYELLYNTEGETNG